MESSTVDQQPVFSEQHELSFPGEHDQGRCTKRDKVAQKVAPEISTIQGTVSHKLHITL